MGSRYYKQMVGRAGRAGLDEFGESFLFLDEKDKNRGLALVKAEVDSIASQLLAKAGKGLERLILEGTCGGYATSRQDINKLLECTMAASEQGIEAIIPLVDAVLRSLIADGFLVQKTREVKAVEAVGDPPTGDPFVFEATPLGQATYHSYFSPEEAKIVYAELDRARWGLVLADDLHMCYLMTPVFNLVTPDWQAFYDCISTASEKDCHQVVLDRVGASRRIIELRARSSAPKVDAAMDRSLSRLFSALMLLDLIKEVPLGDVADKFRQPRGSLQTLMLNASAFANMTVAFCKRLGWQSLEDALGGYVKRLNWGVKPEIVPLTEIRGVGRSRARALWNAGFCSVQAIARSKPDDITRHVNLGPFKDRIARMIVKGARELLDQQARELQKRAEDILAAKNAATATAMMPTPLRRSSDSESQLFGIGLEESLSDDLPDESPIPSI
jgi:replicative superfamily II helicase